MYTFSEMVGRVTLLREFYAPLLDGSSGMVGMKDFESHFAFPKIEKWSLLYICYDAFSASICV